MENGLLIIERFKFARYYNQTNFAFFSLGLVKYIIGVFKWITLQK